MLIFRPHPAFPTISITGTRCAFRCKHCNAHYLSGMIPCSDPRKLLELCERFASKGARGVLLSGGFNRQGYVPFEPFLDAIERIKQRTNLIVSIHPGLPPSWLIRELGRAGVDIADFDLIGDDQTISTILGSEKTTDHYSSALRTMSKHVPHVVPHICIGLNAGKISGEFRAVEIAREVGPEVLVFLILTPTPGTPLFAAKPPSTSDVVKVVRYARECMPRTELALGCMRPRGNGRSRLELAVLRAGASRVVLPSPLTVKEARRSGFKIKTINACCSLPRSLLEEFS